MTLRISKSTVGELTVLHIAGRLLSIELSELDKEVNSVAEPLKLDLSELMSADEAGSTRLRELASSGAKLIT